MITPFRTAFLVAIACFGVAANCGAEDIAIGHFEKGNYGDWTATGTAFARGPAAQGEMLRQLEIENAGDNQVVSSEMEGDGPHGTLTSPEFEIARNYIAFRIGGGDYERFTCVNLVVDGKVVHSATGWRSDRLVPASWDVRSLRGRKAQIQIVDEASGDWGHINISRIVQTDAPERLPIATGPLYQEALRPQFHFTARQWGMSRLNPGMQQEGWINDLNGLIYYDGEYHLFAQRWAKCWLHAVSRDLVHWTELEPAFWEEWEGCGDQSGTCVVDYQNTSGLSPSASNPPMVAFYPRWDNRSQCISYSLDHGRSWKRYEKNPVLVHAERDPKVFWYAPGKHWVMMLYGDGKYHVLTSTNLLSWRDEHHPIADSFECPDFFELPVDGDRSRMKWVLIQGNGNYSIGTFDGTEFKEETPRHPCDVGPNFYATQSWHNTETGDGRRIQVAWMRGSDFPNMPFSQQISFPCELTLHNTGEGLRIFRKPIAELATLYRGMDQWTNLTLRASQTLPMEPSGQLFHVKARVAIPKGAKLIFNILGNRVTLTSNSVESGNAAVTVANEIKTVDVLIDRGSIETFANEGELSSTRFALPRENGLSVTAEDGQVSIDSITVHILNSVWPSGAN